MSNKQQENNSKPFKEKLLAFVKSKDFLPTVVGIVAILVAIGAGIATFFVYSAEDVPVIDSASSEPVWSEPAEDLDYDAEADKVDEETLTDTVLPETPDAGQEYLDETLFLGDSNTVRYMMYSENDNSKKPLTTVKNNIGVVSMGVTAITTLKCEQFEGYVEEVTMPEAVKVLQPRRIIIGFGTNNLGMAADTFIGHYKKGLKAIEKAYPYADIIVNAIPPLDKQRENTSLSMKSVDKLNAAIAKMCEDEGYKYLDSSKALEDPKTGWAKKDYTIGDGVHLSQKGVRAFFEYVRTHAYITEDTRPKPLKRIPRVKGVTPGLITNDPIAVRGARVPVEFIAKEGGKIEGQTSQRVKKGMQTTMVKAVAKDGWYFDGWSATIGHVDQEDSIMFTVPADADANGVVIYANFKKIPEATATPTPELKCICKDTKCTEDSFNPECPVCSQKDGWKNCQGKNPESTSSPTANPDTKPTENPEPTPGGSAQPQETPNPEVTPAPVQPEATPAPAPTPTPPPHCDFCGQDGHTQDACPDRCPYPDCNLHVSDGHTHCTECGGVNGNHSDTCSQFHVEPAPNPEPPAES